MSMKTLFLSTTVVLSLGVVLPLHAQAEDGLQEKIQATLETMNETLSLNPLVKNHVSIRVTENISEPYVVTVTPTATRMEVTLEIKSKALANSMMAREALRSLLLPVQSSVGALEPEAFIEDPVEKAAIQLKQAKLLVPLEAIQGEFGLYTNPVVTQHTSFVLAELQADARMGSIVAKNHLLELEYLKASTALATHKDQLPQENLQATMKDYATQRGLSLDQADTLENLMQARVRNLNDQLIVSRALALGEIRRREKEYYRPEKAAARDLARQSVKLDELVKANDRAGTANLLESMVPWEVMEPSEKLAWKNWIEAIRHPSKETITLYRGLDKYDRPIGLNGDSAGFFAVMINRNQGSYADRLRSLTKAREKLGTWIPSQGEIYSKTIAQMFASHASLAAVSPLISFSGDPNAAMIFAENGFIEVSLDPRRAIPNFSNVLTPEMEFLAPLIIFPDEIRQYVHDADRGSNFKKVSKIIEAQQKAPVKYKNAAYLKNSYQFMSAMTQANTNICSKVFAK